MVDFLKLRTVMAAILAAILDLAAILTFTLELRSQIKCLVMTYNYAKCFACRTI